MESSRNSTENNFECEICEKSFQTNQKMNQHIKLVHGKGSYVIFVESPSLNLEIWRFTSGRSMKDKEIINVILVKNLSLNQDYWRFKSGQFMKDKEITNVILVESPSFVLDILSKIHIKTLHEEQRNYKCYYCIQSFTQTGSLKNHIQRLHEGQ